MTRRSALDTDALIRFATGLRREDIPPALVHEAKRALLNITATGIAGCREPAIGIALAALDPFAGPATASLTGRGERRDAALAAFVNAMAANIHDFDDTHPGTIVHPTAPVAPALLALAETRPCSGADLIRAFLIGGEIECRLGNAVSPEHYAKGWHITSSCGVVGAAAAAAALIGLDAERMGWAIANAAVQPAGLVATLGTMSKSISVGDAARGGLLAALMAEKGFEGPAGALDAFLTIACAEPKPEALTDGLGEDWTFATNTYKPWPVGVVLNPVIDASLEIAARPGFDPAAVEAVELTGHPLLRARADRPGVTTGRESQVSAQHAIAVVWQRGRAGLDEFTDAAVAGTMGARPVVTFRDDPGRDPAGVRMVVRMRNGAAMEAEVAAARGTLGNPMSDGDIEGKLVALAERSGFKGNVPGIIEMVWDFANAPNAGELARLASGIS